MMKSHNDRLSLTGLVMSKELSKSHCLVFCLMAALSSHPEWMGSAFAQTTAGTAPFIAPVFNSETQGRSSFLRIYNPESTSRTATVRLIDDVSGQVLGSFVATVPGWTSQQYEVNELESQADMPIIPAGMGQYSVAVSGEASFKGFAQHVIWNEEGGSLTNISGCGADRARTRYVGNVHTQLLTDFPSQLVVHNTGVTGSTAFLGITGGQINKFISFWQSPVIPAQGSMTFNVNDILDEVEFVPEAGEFHVNFYLHHNELVGYVQHIVDNTKSAVLTNMTENCHIDGSDVDSGAITPPASLQLDPFFQKYVDADGFPVVGSARVSAQALQSAASVISHMLSARTDLRQSLINQEAYYVIMAENEWLSEVPGLEYVTRKPTGDGREWDQLRGFGGVKKKGKLFAGSNEEDLLRRPTSRAIAVPVHTIHTAVHEFAHQIHVQAIQTVDNDLYERINDAYDAAVSADLWTGEYINVNAQEYWGVGTNMWFNVNFETEGKPQNTREELLEHDPVLHALLAEVYPEDYIPGFDRYPNPSEQTQSSEPQSSVTGAVIPRHLVPLTRNYQ